jgi:hypothetical protein
MNIMKKKDLKKEHSQKGFVVKRIVEIIEGIILLKEEEG